MDCAGFVQAIHRALILPSATASNRSTAVLPGASGTRGTPHSAATSARCWALDRSRCALSRLAMPPTSRPPIALGCPVSENGPAPGLPIWPVARCRLISAVFLAVPLLLWFRPWQYRDRVGPRANQRAAWTRSASGTPHSLAVSLGGKSRTRSRRASKPRVWVSMNARSVNPSQTIRCSSPWNSATSVPGSSGRYRSANSAVSVRRGSATMTRICGRARLASSRRRNRIG